MFASAGLFLAAPLLLQDPSASASARREAAFARALTSELNFVDLAEAVLEKSIGTASGPDRSVLLLARCDIRKVAAQNAKKEEKLGALAVAGQAYAEFLASSPPSFLATDARVALGELAFYYGTAIASHLEETQPSEEEKAELAVEADSIFMAAKEGLDLIITNWENLDDGDEKDELRFKAYFPSRFYKAQIFYYWGMIFPPESLDRGDRIQKSLSLFEDFAMLVGESSIAGLRAYKFMADTYLLQAETFQAKNEPEDAATSLEDAEIFYQHIIENAIPEGVDLMDAEIDGRRDVMQEAYLGLIKMYRNWDRESDARQQGKTFQTWVDDEGVILAPAGYRANLQVALGLINSGDFGEAISIAEMVASENQGSILQLEANSMMSTAIAAAPANAPIDLGVLYAAAEGAYWQKEFLKAKDGFLLLLGRLQGSRQADDFGAGAYYFLGRSYSYLDQRLEATVSHQVGFELFPDDDDYASKNAEAWMKLSEVLRSSAPGDSFLDQYWKTAVDAVATS
ncbi:MAG: hypothetical protein QF524_08740, partial [Planctomycetota bacterium]|nr:hypothetical protein [Planctomycetota bacterium]